MRNSNIGRSSGVASGVDYLDASAGASTPTSLREPGNSRLASPRPPGIPGTRRERTGSRAQGNAPRKASLPSMQARDIPRSQRTTVGVASSSTSWISPASPVLSAETQKVVYPSSEFRSFQTVSNVVGATYDKPDRGLGIPEHIKYGPLAEPMVRCSDGIIRRYPRADDGSRNYLGQIKAGLIYDIAADRVSHRIGGIELSADQRHAAFLVNGYPVSPIQVGSQFNAYPLPNGRMLVPQPGFRDCTNACELMMLLDHGDVSLDNAHSYNARTLGTRRELTDVMGSLRRRTGRTPVLVEHNVNYRKGLLGGQHASRKQAWRDLAKKIEEMGPCILSKGGHVVMLDGVREEHGKFFLTIREPFHGTSLEFRDSAAFFADERHTPEHAHIDAIFLKKSQT